MVYMPLNSGDTQVPCAVCLNQIIEDKDDALFCEGHCQQWLHRCCAGITLALVQYRILISSNDPFLCLACI